MTATVKEWNRYQVTKALLRQEQQNVLTVIEGYMKREEPGCTLGGIEFFNREINYLRGSEYSPAENHRFLLELGKVDIGANDRVAVPGPFNGVRLYHRRDGRNIFSINFSYYFSEEIGAYIRDEKEA